MSSPSGGGRPSFLDLRLLADLERAFESHAGADHVIDVADLARALGLRSEDLARRVLRALDLDQSGTLDRTEFLEAVRTLVFGSERDKLWFVFRLHDEDGDGVLSELEILRMISISLAESDLATRRSQPPERLARAVAREADRDGDGRITFDEFCAAMARHPELLARITRSEATWLAPAEELLQRLTERASSGTSPLRHRLENHAGDLALFVVYLAVSALALAHGVSRAGVNAPATLQLGRALGPWLSFSAALLLVPVLRKLVMGLRKTWFGRVFDVDSAIDLHRWLGHGLFALGLVHGGAYLAAYWAGHPALGLLHLVTATPRGLTGAMLVVVFAVMWLCALPFVRRSQRFELFYFTHSLYIVFLGLLALHGPAFLLWGGAPVLWLLVEQVGRRRRRGPTTSARVRVLRSGVTLLELERPPGFRFEAGDYVLLNVPHLARHEWHPFTLSCSEAAAQLTLHVRSLGNFTSALRRDAEARERTGDVTYPVRIDGPHGSPTAHLFATEHAIMIGAGVGVTPFASVLASLADARDDRPIKLKSVEFYWLNRDAYSFEWFGDLLARLERQPLPLTVAAHVHMTGGHAGAASAMLDMARDLMHAEGSRDLVTGLRRKTQFGHPDWDAEFARIARAAAPEPVTVFFCGPAGLARKLRACCVRHGMRFREEKF